MARIIRERTLSRSINTITVFIPDNINTTGVVTKNDVKNSYKIKTKKIYCMTEHDFLKYAKVLPPR